MDTDKIYDKIDSVLDNTSRLPDLLHEMRKTNVLLKLIVKQAYATQLADRKQSNTANDLNCYVGKNLIVESESFVQAETFAKNLADLIGTKLRIIEGGGVFDVSAELSRGHSGDICLINLDKLTDKAVRVILTPIKQDMIDFVVGKGASATDVNIKLEHMHYIAYTDMIETVPLVLRELLELVTCVEEINRHCKVEQVSTSVKQDDKPGDNKDKTSSKSTLF